MRQKNPNKNRGKEDLQKNSASLVKMEPVAGSETIVESNGGWFSFHMLSPLRHQNLIFLFFLSPVPVPQNEPAEEAQSSTVPRQSDDDQFFSLLTCACSDPYFFLSLRQVQIRQHFRFFRPRILMRLVFLRRLKRLRPLMMVNYQSTIWTSVPRPLRIQMVLYVLCAS